MLFENKMWILSRITALWLVSVLKPLWWKELKSFYSVCERVSKVFRISPTRNCIFIVPTNPHVNVSLVFCFLKLVLSRFLKGILGTFSPSIYILIKVYMCPLNLKVRFWDIKILDLYFFSSCYAIYITQFTVIKY